MELSAHADTNLVRFPGIMTTTPARGDEFLNDLLCQHLRRKRASVVFAAPAVL